MFLHLMHVIYRQSAFFLAEIMVSSLALTLLHPFSLMKGVEHLLHLRINAADMASSMV